VTRKNKYTGLSYKDEPAIMSWQLANEPRAMQNREKFLNWIETTSSFIKSLDSNHLVTVGSEGETPFADAGMKFTEDHQSKSVDYSTIHIWAQNWMWYDPLKAKTYEPAKNRMLDYFKDHLEKSNTIKKPMVVEEFGLARDKGSFDPASSTVSKDNYYSEVFNAVYTAASNGAPVSGVNFWAWSGESLPSKPYGSFWKSGDDFTGDPPHEQQGWYSVYTKDSSTVKIISEFAGKMNALNK